MKNKYAKAYTEVLEIIKHLPQNEYEKIPYQKIEFYEKNKDRDYNLEFDPTKPIEEQNISIETNAVIISLFRDYFASDTQKEKLKKILMNNERKYNEALELKHSSNIFANMGDKYEFKADEINDESLDNETNSLIQYKESILKKFFNYIINIFKIRK